MTLVSNALDLSLSMLTSWYGFHISFSEASKNNSRVSVRMVYVRARRVRACIRDCLRVLQLQVIVYTFGNYDSVARCRSLIMKMLTS